jgi:hypothetical protein
MAPRDIFVTAMRVIGVLQLIRAFDYALEVFDIYSGYYKPVMTTIGSCTTHTVFFFVLGVYLLLGAPAVTRALFPRTQDSKSARTDVEADGKPEV